MFRSIKVLTGTTIDVEKFINDCINEYELFVLEEDKFYSRSFLNRMNLMIEKQQKRSEQARIAGKRSAEVRRQKKNNENGTAVEQPLVNNSTAVEQPLEDLQRN